MRNPWLKKNPAMSIFLSAANAWMGAARGQVNAAMKRQAAASAKVSTSTGKKRGGRTRSVRS